MSQLLDQLGPEGRVGENGFSILRMYRKLKGPCAVPGQFMPGNLTIL